MAKAQPITTIVPRAPMRLNAALPLQTRLDECMACAARIHGPEDIAALHALRIAVKRLRYTIEIFADVLPGSDDFLKTCKRWQDFLGEIHDADVLAPLLAKSLDARHDRPGVRALHERTLADRARLHEEFTTDWQTQIEGGFPERLEAAMLVASTGDTARSVDPALGDLLPLLGLAEYAAESARPGDLRRARKALRALVESLEEDDDVRDKAIGLASDSLRRMIERSAP